MRVKIRFLVLAVIAALLLTSVGPVQAGAVDVQKISDGVYAFVGPLGNRDKVNFGNNATFGLVVTKAGAVLIDSGGSAKGAAMIDEAIRTVTDKPVVAVVNTGGQDHRWLGNGYFKAKGATIYAAAAAVADQKARYSQQVTGLELLIGADGLAGTEPVHADVTFEGRRTLDIGGTVIELIATPAHTPGDAIVWLPAAKVAFAGDVVFVDRLLGILDVSLLNAWVDSFAALEALQPAHVVPGHGPATTLARAQADTGDYLRYLQSEVRKVVAAGKGDRAAVALDQSRWSGLGNFDQLAKRNALAAYIQLEFE